MKVHNPYCYHNNLLLRDSKRILTIFLMNLGDLISSAFNIFTRSPASFDTGLLTFRYNCDRGQAHGILFRGSRLAIHILAHLISVLLLFQCLRAHFG